MPTNEEQEATRERALGVRWPCGCVTYADSEPGSMTVKGKRLLGDYIAQGAEIIRCSPDELQAMPYFLPRECPHTPKGWEPSR